MKSGVFLVVAICALAGCGPSDQQLADQAKKKEEASGSVVLDMSPLHRTAAAAVRP